MTNADLKNAAAKYLTLAKDASEGMRTVYLKKARGYYSEAGMYAAAAWCERMMG